MPFVTHNYRIRFMLNSKTCWEFIQAWSPAQAIQLIQQRYPGATSFSWWEV